MTRYIATRILLGLVTLFCVTVLIFVATNLLPGDAATEILGRGATPETVARFRAELGLDDPLAVRYVHWLGDLLRGDLGHSLTTQASINEMIGARLVNTLRLAGLTALVSVPLALGLGILSAAREGTFLDRALAMVALTAISFPEFFTAYLLILVFSVKLGLFPNLSTIFPEMSFLESLRAMVLPMMALSCLVTAHMMRMTRTSILSVMSQPYIEMAFLKGVPRAAVITRHALPNAAAPIIAVVAMNLAYLVVGIVVIEVVFVYPGLGQYMVDAVGKRDIPVVQACGVFFALAFIGLNLISDVLAVLVNPRLRRPNRGK